MSTAWAPKFPTTEMVGSAAAMFTRHVVEDRAVTVSPDGRPLTPHVPNWESDAQRQAARDYLRQVFATDPAYKGYELEPIPEAELQAGLLEETVPQPVTALFPQSRRWQPDREWVEGARWRVEVAPGMVAVRRHDPVRAERAKIRQEAVREAEVRSRKLDLLAGRVTPEREAGRGVVRSWSRKSRTAMSKLLGTLDWAPLFEDGAVPAMVTLTYPRDWLAVAPESAVCQRHVDLLRKRFARAWGRKLIGVWKREFQRRGAPHYHLLMVPPTGQDATGRKFSEWLSQEWASIVGSSTVVQVPFVESERALHLRAGTGIDYAEGMKANDPKRIGVYFSKHGAYAAKEYQNEAPEEWTGSVGRFWGYWGLSKALESVEVAPREGLAIGRTLRRYSRANSYVARVPVWRYRTVRDPETGEVTAKWRRSTKVQRIYRVQRSTGFLVVNDGPALASAVARHLDQLVRPEAVVTRSGAPPRGSLDGYWPVGVSNPRLAAASRPRTTAVRAVG